MQHEDARKALEHAERLLKTGRGRRFKRKIILQGTENLSPDAQYVYFPNHTSHFDDVLVYALLSQNLPYPVVAAGANLDVWPINRLVPISNWDTIMINRKIADSGTNEEKIEHLSHLEDEVHSSMIIGKSLLVFIEGGRRNPNETMGSVKTGFLGYILSSFKNRQMEGKEVFGVNTAIHYDKIIEAKYLPAMRKAMDLGKKLKVPSFGQLAYYSLDLAAYFSRYFLSSFGSNPGNMYVRFGKPYPLRDFTRADRKSSISRKKVLADHIAEDVRNLHSSLRADCSNGGLSKEGTIEVLL